MLRRWWLMDIRRLLIVFASLFYCVGPIPEALGSLTNLTMLDLTYNQLTGNRLRLRTSLVAPQQHIKHASMHQVFSAAERAE